MVLGGHSIFSPARAGWSEGLQVREDGIIRHLVAQERPCWPRRLRNIFVSSRIRVESAKKHIDCKSRLLTAFRPVPRTVRSNGICRLQISGLLFGFTHSLFTFHFKTAGGDPMPWSQVAYSYDSTFNGFSPACMSYVNREQPACFSSPGDVQLPSIGAGRGRPMPPTPGIVLVSLPRKLSADGLHLVTHGFLTCLPEKRSIYTIFCSGL